jgi:hypothetical protein
MFEHRKFDVDVRRIGASPMLRWPDPGESGSESNLGGNRSYSDLRGIRWSEAREMLETEISLFRRIELADDPEAEYLDIEEEAYQGAFELCGLDVGVASTVAMLSAAGMITCSSCNGGAFGGGHHETYPLVAFFAKPFHLPILIRCAEEANVGLECSQGTLVVYANNISCMMDFAASLSKASSAFRLNAKAASAAKNHASRQIVREKSLGPNLQQQLPFDQSNQLEPLSAPRRSSRR